MGIGANRNSNDIARTKVWGPPRVFFVRVVIEKGFREQETVGRSFVKAVSSPEAG